MPNYYGTAQLLHGANYLTSQHRCIGVGCVGCLGRSSLGNNENESQTSGELIDKKVDKSGYYVALGAKLSIVLLMGFAMYRISK